MSFAFGAHCDDFHVSTRLYLKLDLGLQRETVLHFFDGVKREFPTMRRLRRRDDASLQLEDDEAPDNGRRWLRLDEMALRFGYRNPPSLDAVARLGQVVLKMAPYHLTLSELDYDHLEVVHGFDLEYCGNHDQLVAETLFADSPLMGLLCHDSVVHTLDAQPFIGVSVSESCDTQVYIEIKSHTSTYEVRTRHYEPQALSVYLTVRRYWGFSETDALLDVHQTLCETAAVWAVDKVVPLVINPLAQAIASRP